MSDGAAMALARVEAAWRPFEQFVSGMGREAFERDIGGGRNAREMLAHVAFWDEAVVPVLTYMLRGEEIPDLEFFGSGYRPGATWPSDDVHNAREAEWARSHSAEDVKQRLTSAHAAMTDAVASITDEEAPQRASYIQEQCDHYREHLAELTASSVH